MAWRIYQSGVHRCGFHRSETTDKSIVYMPGFDDCPVCAGAEQYARELAEADRQAREQLPKDAPARTPLPSDGRTVVMRQVPPDEAEQLRADRAAARRRPLT